MEGGAFQVAGPGPGVRQVEVPIGSGQVARVPPHELRSFVAEGWQPLGAAPGRWAQSMRELHLVLELPRKTRLKDVAVEIGHLGDGLSSS